MSAVENWSGSPRQPGSGDGVLRHPNGSIDIGVYAAIAHRQRAAAIRSSMLSAVRLIREAWEAITARRAHQQAAVGKPCGWCREDGRKTPRDFPGEAAENIRPSASQHRRAITSSL